MGVEKGYKQTEVGVIPEDWEVRTIGSICNIVAGGDLTTLDYSFLKTQDYKYPVYSNAISNYGLHSYSKTYQFVPDKITITARGSIGFAKHRNEKFCAIGRLLVLSKIINMNLNYIAEHINHLITFAIESTGVPQLTAPQVSKYHVAFPPKIEEQKAIATALSDTDYLIDSLSKLIEKKKNIKQGAMQELLTGKKRLEGFSGEWELHKMGNLFNFSGGYSASRGQLSEEGYSYLHYGDIHGSVKTFVDIKDEYLEIPKLNIELNEISKDKLLQDGDVVFVDASEDDEGVSKHVVIRNTHGIPFISGLHTIVAKSRNNLLHNLYKEYCFQSKEVKKQFAFYAVGIKVSGISRSNIAKIALKIPPTIEEQTAIATILSDMDSEIEKLQAKLDKYKAIKQGMMQELLTGRIRLLEGA